MSILKRDKSNYKLWLIGGFLTLIVTLNGCKSAEKVPVGSFIKLSQPWVFNIDFQKAIYKTNMLVYGNELSGLTLIKKTGEGFRVVFMSEVGLKYFDMEFFIQKDSVKIHHIISLLNKKPVTDMLEENFSLVFMMFPDDIKEKYHQDAMTQSMVKEFKHKRVKSLYTYNQHFGQVSTIHQRFGGSNLIISLGSFDHLSPQTINSNQRNLSLRLDKIEP